MLVIDPQHLRRVVETLPRLINMAILLLARRLLDMHEGDPGLEHKLRFRLVLPILGVL